MTITTVQTVKGTVWHITPPLSVILTLEDGKNQQFKIPEDQKFNVEGQMVDAWGLRKGMIITATKIVEQEATEVTQQKTVTGQAAPPADVPILVAEGSEEAVPTPTAEPATAPAAAPEAASGLSTTGIIGLLCLVVVAAVVVWYVVRKRRSQT